MSIYLNIKYTKASCFRTYNHCKKVGMVFIGNSFANPFHFLKLKTLYISWTISKLLF